MIRATLAALAGLLLGAAAAPSLVWLASLWLNAQPSAPVMLVDRWVIYLTLVLGAGFGALTGAVVGMAGAVAAALRRREADSPPRKV
jgi:hypothetical protein